MPAEEFISALENKKNILLISHRGPDGDTLGSAAAMAFFLESLEKKVSLFCIHEIPPVLSFINLEKFILKEELNLQKFDLIIAVDCADLPQTGIPEKIESIKNQIPIINIDHHYTNPNYGDINIVDPHASSTAEIIYHLFKKCNINLTKEITSALLTGILVDTTYFSNAATTEQAVAAAADLLKNGAKLRQIIQNTWCKHSPESLKLWGKVLSELQYNPEHKIVTAIVPPEDSMEKAETPLLARGGEIFEGLANFLTSIYEADIILVLRQDANGMIKCSMRTTKNNINVAKLAQKFGGGGHPKAAGYSFPGKIIRTEKGWQIQ